MSEKAAYEELEQRVREFEKAESDRKKAEEVYQQKIHDFDKRAKELNCLHGISNLVENADNSIEMIIQGVVELIPPSWQYPEITCSRIILEDKEYKTENFKESSWKQSVDIIVRGERSGILEVHYLEEQLEIDEGPFLREERTLINSIAERLGHIIERIRAEEALKESEDRYRMLFEGAAEGILIAEIKSRKFQYANPALCRMLGYTEEELKQMIVDNIHPKEDLEHVMSEFESQALGEKKLAQDIPCLRKEGITIYADINTSNISINGKECNVGFFTDVTDRVQAEEKRRELESRLQQTYKMEAIGTLAGGIAHDFNNILSPIMIHSEMAMMDLPPDSPLHNRFKQIYQAGERARDMVKQILAFSCQRKQERAPIMIGTVLKEVVRLLRSSFPSTIDIHYNIEAEEDNVFADPTQIHQVLLNICTNASRAMSEKGGVLEIGLDDLDLDSEAVSEFTDLDPGPYLRLTVSDTGHGIEPEIIKKVFDPFFTTKEVGEGTGMGLAVVHGIVKSHGGNITVESEPGKGTTFQILFPKYEANIPKVSEQMVQYQRGTERILFVDDEKSGVDAIQPMLEGLGYQVTARTSSVEALELFRNKPDAFDLVITDMTMPNMTGKDLAKELMSIRSDIPIILCTGFSDQIDEHKAKAMGISAFVMKPIVMGQIASTIREVLDGKGD